MRIRKFQKNGFGLVEVVVGVSVALIVFFSVGQVSLLALKASEEKENRLRALNLAEEGIEAVRNLRDAGWSSNIANLNFGSKYYVATSSSGWILTSTNPGLIDGKFKRYVVMDSVSRDANDDITESGGTDDPGTKKVTSVVSWGGSSKKSSIYFEDGTTDINSTVFPSSAGWGDPAQSFTVGSNPITVLKVDLLLKKTDNPSDIYLQIRSSNPDGPVLGTSQTVSGANLPSSLGWVSFEFSSPVALAANTKYYLRLSSIPPSTYPAGALGLIYWGYLSSKSNIYPSGEAYIYVKSGSWYTLNNYDFSFRIFEETVPTKKVELTTYITNILND